MYQNITSIAISGKGFETKLKPYVNEGLKFNYLPNWADELNMDLEAAKFSEDKKIHFTFAGNIGKVQNLENIIKAFSSLASEYRIKSQLNIIGDGSNLEELKKITVSTNIIFHGKRPREDMAMYYKASDFLIVSLIDKPIFSVTVPAKTQTYIAAQKPILAIINGDTADLIKENNLGFCAKPNDIKEIQEAFVKCINLSNEEIQNFTKNCEHLTKTVFSKTKIIDSLEKILTSRI